MVAFVARGVLPLSVQGQLMWSAEERVMIENFANDERRLRLTLRCAFLNAARMGGGQHGPEEVIRRMRADAGDWGIAFVCELDGVGERELLPVHGYEVRRHWPGQGSCSVAFIWPTWMGAEGVDVRWRGRAGAALLRGRDVAGQQRQVWVVGVHASHGEPLFEDLLDVAILAKARLRWARLLLVGDWNSDLLRELDLGAFEFREDEPNWEDRMRMDAVKNLAEELHVEIHEPKEVKSAAGGPWGELSSVVPMTRIPGGDHSEYVTPTCLDWVMCEDGAVRSFEVHWRAAPRDHAICMVETDWNILQKPRQNKFIVQNWESAVEWLKRELTIIEGDLMYDEATDMLRRMAAECEDTSTCAARRTARIPFEVRQLWPRACEVRLEHERRQLRRQAATILKRFIADKNLGRLEKTVRRGAMPMKLQALKEIKEMVLESPDGDIRTSDKDAWKMAVEKFFAEKSGANDELQRLDVLNFVPMRERERAEFDDAAF